VARLAVPGGAHGMTPPLIDCEQTHTGLPVRDLTAAIAFYTAKLGFRLSFTWGEPEAHFAGLHCGRAEIFLAVSPECTPHATCTAFYLVAEVDALYEFHRAQGVEILEPIADRAYGIRDYSVRDLYGHQLMFGQHLPCPEDRAEPKLVVERVEVTARIEKRLAALLADLAAHKGMTVGSCLEEMILHTNEGAGPHTALTRRHIEELKKRHGIDYDCHASYRFTEER